MKDLKHRVFESNLELVRRNLVIYTWGNVSAIDREQGFIIIKPRGIEYDEMSVDDMVTVDFDGNIVEGMLLPSVDLDIHLALYKKFIKIQGIAHTHSTWATAWAQACSSIPVLGTTHADHFYGSIPCTRSLRLDEINESYELHTGEAIIETFVKIDPVQIPGVLVAKHGSFTWGNSPEKAVEHSVILEEIARMAKLTTDMNPDIKSISQSLLDRHFLRKHGPDSYFYQDK